MRATILLVDSDIQRRTRLRAMTLEGVADVGIKEADNNSAALLLIKNGDIDVVVCAHEPPLVDALGMVRSIRSAFALPSLPCIVLSAVYHVDMRQSAFALGANDCVMLPCPPAELASRVQMHLRFKQAHFDVQQLGEQQRHLAIHDPLTGLVNRDHFFIETRRELARAQRHAFPISVCAFDIDHFRQLNAQLGHVEGDTLIMEVGQMIEQALRAPDTLARTMGARFLALLPQADGPQAARVCERLRANVRSYPFGALPTGSVTLSLGVVSYPHEAIDTVDALINAAETSLERAKKAGGDCVETWNP